MPNKIKLCSDSAKTNPNSHAIIEERYAEQIAECQMNLTNAKAAYQAHSAEMMEYETEILKVIRGESKLNSDLLNKLYEEAKEKAAQSGQVVRQLEEQIKNSEQMKAALSKQLDNIKTWSDMFDECNMETMKMILAHIMKAVRVKRGYEIEIDLTVDCEQLWLLTEETETTLYRKERVRIWENPLTLCG